MMPSEFIHIDEIPVSTNHKTDKKSIVGKNINRVYKMDLYKIQQNILRKAKIDPQKVNAWIYNNQSIVFDFLLNDYFGQRQLFNIRTNF